jgi:hypothetical protein
MGYQDPEPWMDVFLGGSTTACLANADEAILPAGDKGRRRPTCRAHVCEQSKAK